MLAKTLDEGFVPQNIYKRKFGSKNAVWLNAKREPFKIYGVFFDAQEGKFLRMDKSVLSHKKFDTVIKGLNTDTSGGRLRFCTDSPFIALYAKQENNLLINTMNLCGHSGFDLYAENYVGTFLPKTNTKNGLCDVVETDGKMHCYTVNFPLFDNVEEIYIGLDEDALVIEAEPYPNESRPIVFYGSSITQGACASRPGNCYTSVLSRALNADYINLGFAGRCHGETEIAEYAAKLHPSVFVMDYDHNAISFEELKERHEPFYLTVRKENPDIPIIIMSAPDIAVKKQEFEKRREVIRETCENALKRHENVIFIDGETLYGDTPYDATVDGVHPNDLGFYNMAKTLIKQFSNIKF